MRRRLIEGAIRPVVHPHGAATLKRVYSEIIGPGQQHQDLRVRAFSRKPGAQTITVTTDPVKSCLAPSYDNAVPHVAQVPDRAGRTEARIKRLMEDKETSHG